MGEKALRFAAIRIMSQQLGKYQKTLQTPWGKIDFDKLIFVKRLLLESFCRRNAVTLVLTAFIWRDANK